MLSLKTIRRRIVSVKNMQKVTKAMKLVAAAKLRKAQRDALSARFYSDNLRDMIVNISKRAGYNAPPLMRRRDVKNIDIIVITSEKGLCGTFNENLLRSVFEMVEEHTEHGIGISLFVAGKKGWHFFKLKKMTIQKVEMRETNSLNETIEHLTKILIERFLTGLCDGTYLAFNRFVSTARQEITFWDFLPLHWRGMGPERQLDYIYEPDREKFINDLIRKMLKRSIVQALLESDAAELAARMLAMDKATKNADDMIENLTLQYNKARQSAITSELLDIVGGAEALQ